MSEELRLLRIRFLANLEDCRPVNYPVEFPWWKTGETETRSVIISYADSEQYIYKNWPEAIDLEISEEKKIIFTDRFPKGEWDSKKIPFEVLTSYIWRVRTRLPERFGQLCVVLARGKMNNALIQFEDGYKVITSRNYIRKVHP